jgi:hypothetical protein
MHPRKVFGFSSSILLVAMVALGGWGRYGTVASTQTSVSDPETMLPDLLNRSH